MSSSFAAKDSLLSRYRDRIEAQLGLPLYDMISYHLGWIGREGKPQQGQAGKTLRGALCLMACAAAGGEAEVAPPAAAAVELVHNYSLVHDDIQDNDRERRHRPMVWAIWNQPQGIDAGTAMGILADLSIALLGEALAMGFQIRDDILGMWGVSRSTGKPIGSDILRRKKDFPVVYALLHGDPTQQSRLRGLYSEDPPGPAQLQGVLEILEAVEARDAAERAEKKYSDDALLALDGLALSPADRSLLEGLLSFLAGRSA